MELERVLMAVAVDILGEKTVAKLLDTALAEATTTLKEALVRMDVPQLYATLALRACQGCGAFVLREGAPALAHKFTSIVDAGSLDLAKGRIVEVCIIVLGEEEFARITQEVIHAVEQELVSLMHQSSVSPQLVSLVSEIAKVCSRGIENYEKVLDGMQKIMQSKSDGIKLAETVLAVANNLLGEEAVKRLMDCQDTAVLAKAALLDRLFRQYDLDGSGTLNTNNELYMLTLNMITKLGWLVKKQVIEEKLASVGQLDDNNAWGQQQFMEWFDRQHFGEFSELAGTAP